MNLKTSNIIIFGLVGLIVAASWTMTIWTVFAIPIASGVMVLASSLVTWNYVSFITTSLEKQRLNKIYNGKENKI